MFRWKKFSVNFHPSDFTRRALTATLPRLDLSRFVFCSRNYLTFRRGLVPFPSGPATTPRIQTEVDEFFWPVTVTHATFHISSLPSLSPTRLCSIDAASGLLPLCVVRPSSYFTVSSFFLVLIFGACLSSSPDDLWSRGSLC